MISEPHFNLYYSFKEEPSPNSLQALGNWLRDNTEKVDDKYWPVIDENGMRDGVIIPAVYKRHSDAPLVLSEGEDGQLILNDVLLYEYIPQQMTVRQLSKVTGMSRARIYQLLQVGKLTLPLTLDKWLTRDRGKAGRPLKHK